MRRRPDPPFPPARIFDRWRAFWPAACLAFDWSHRRGPEPDEEGFYPPSGTVASKKKRKPFEIFNLGAPERELIATVKEKHMMDVFKTIQDEVNKKIDVLENKVDGLEYEIRNLKKKNKC